jgi:hypothetical protein
MSGDKIRTEKYGFSYLVLTLNQLLMFLLRFLLMAFNVAVIGFLIYKMIEMVQKPVERSKKVIFLTGGILLLFAPLGIFFRFFGAAPQYFLIYPIAIFLFLYLTKQV